MKFVFRNLAFLGQESIVAAEAAECAADQNQFWPYHDKLFEAQTGENVGRFSKDNLKQFATDLKLDTASFNRCLDSDKYLSKVQNDKQEATSKGVQRTPTLFINGVKYEGVPSWDDLKRRIDSAVPAQQPTTSDGLAAAAPLLVGSAVSVGYRRFADRRRRNLAEDEEPPQRTLP